MERLIPFCARFEQPPILANLEAIHLSFTYPKFGNLCKFNCDFGHCKDAHHFSPHESIQTEGCSLPNHVLTIDWLKPLAEYYMYGSEWKESSLQFSKVFLFPVFIYASTCKVFATKFLNSLICWVFLIAAMWCYMYVVMCKVLLVQMPLLLVLCQPWLQWSFAREGRLSTILTMKTLS